MKIHKKIYDKYLSVIRINELIKRLKPLLKDSKNVLDVGCGNGRISKILMKENPNLYIKGIDVFNIENSQISYKIFDGKKIPYKKKSFDTIILIDVLHHTENIEELIKECIKVSKKYIIIKDHYYKNLIDYLILKIYDYIGNKPYNINLPYNFKKIGYWKKLIRNNNLEEIYFKKFRYKMQPGKQLIM